MTRKNILEMFKKKKALLAGHFLLSSGLHSEKYMQCALVLQYPKVAARLCEELAGKFSAYSVDVVVSPALGGVIVGQETAKVLGARAVFCERVEGKMRLRRGFNIEKGERVLVVEDVVTTGGSVMEVAEVAGKEGGRIIGFGAIVDRRSDKADPQLKSLLKLEIKTYKPGDCPLCKKGIKIDKPGSR